MFSNLTPNSILYVFDINNNPKILSGPVESVSVPRPKYNTFNPNMEMVLDITATIAGERREFKGVPNTSIANFGESAFILAENKDVLNSYLTSMLQNSMNIINSKEKHEKLAESYEQALEELNPSNKSDSKAIQSLQDQVASLQEGMRELLNKLNKETSN